jgi:RecB family exonuclease
MHAKVFWNIRDWAHAVAQLPAQGPLPCRTVLVPSEAVAHVLRRELIRSDQSKALAGTRFLPPAAAAIEVLHEAGVVFEAGEESLRSVRILSLFRAGLTLSEFPLDLLRSTPGWDEAFARTISALEEAGLRPADLEGSGSPNRLRDVAAVWRAADDSAGPSWTVSRIYSEAAGALERNPNLWTLPGPALACAAGDVTGVEARFLRAIPGVTVGLLAGRPLRKMYLDRMESLLGRDARDALLSARVPEAHATERDLLVSFLFESPAALADPKRPRSTGPDGTVELEEHSGIEAELEATADWVARQIGSGIPLEEIAVLLPTLDSVAGLVVERIARLPFGEGGLPVHAAGGLLLTGTSAGARALAVVRALGEYLSPEALSEVLPALRTLGPESRHLSHGAAMDLAWSLGTVGGNPARPEGALEWAVRAVEKQAELTKQLALAKPDEEDGDGASFGRRTWDNERLLQDLVGIAPALDALVGLARQTIERKTLAELWPSFRLFLKDWLLQPAEGPRVHDLLDARLAKLASDSACGSLTGDDALTIIEETINSVRVPLGRFGEPAVYVGSVHQAVGLSFRAVRIIGLAEGRFPLVPREDPVVPDSLRSTLRSVGPSGMVSWPTTAADRALDDLHALDIVIRSAQDRVALSAPRTDLERSQREPSSIFLEVAAALGRPNRATGEAGRTIPDSIALERDGFEPAREVAAAFRRDKPLGEAAWQDGVSRGELGVPPRWCGIPSLDLARIEKLRSPEAAGAMDGMLGIADLTMLMPGLTAELPTSPSVLKTLLTCPHQFLLANLLKFGEPSGAPPQREIGQPYYGNLFHAVAARFSTRHGVSFGAREGAIADWLLRADAVSDSAFDEFLKEYPLVGNAVRAQQRDRLRRDLRELLEYEWLKPKPPRLIASERGFGRPTPVELKIGNHSLFLRGRIDRIEVEGGTTVVTDFKTGKPSLRIGEEENPDPLLDLQVATYALVTRSLAAEWKVPKKVSGTYVYVGRTAVTERDFRPDFDENLEPKAWQWLAIAAGLLSQRDFPRTPDPEDCKYCRFRPVCGDAVYDRATAVLNGLDGPLGDFRVLKAGPLKQEKEE